MRIRGIRDPETGSAQSFSGLTQVTIHGIARSEEDLSGAIRRELGEELREMLRESGQPHGTDKIESALLRHFPHRLNVLSRQDTSSERVITFGCLINQDEALSCLELLFRAKQLRIIRKSDLPKIRTINPLDVRARETHFSPDEIVMFPDEYNALKRAFDMPVEMQTS